MNIIDRQSCSIISDEAMEALAVVADKHALTLTRKAGSFDPFNFTFKVVFTATIESGAPADFEDNALLLGLPEGCWGREIRHRGETVKIRGFEMRRPKYPVIVKRPNGKDLLLTVDGVRGQLALAELEAKAAAAG
jgi:hypothetical protein